MKFTNLLPISEQQVMEGVTFGRSQMNMVQQSGNVQIGIEYEFTLDEVDSEGAREDGGTDPDQYMEVYRDARRELEEEKEEAIKDDMEHESPDSGNAAYALVNAIQPLAAFNNAIDRIKVYVDVDEDGSVDVDELSEEERDDLGDALQDMGIAFQKIHNEQGNLEDFGNELEESYQVFTIDQVALDYEDISDFENELYRGGNHYDVDEMDKNPFEEFEDTDDIESAVQGYINAAQNLLSVTMYERLLELSNQGLKIDTVKDILENTKDQWIEDGAKERVEDIFGNEIEAEATRRAEQWEEENAGGSMDTHEHAELADRYLQDEEDLYRYIEEVHPDGPGVLAEARGTLMDLDPGIDHMHGMLEFIRRRGWTDERAGMHVNVSLKDHPMTTEYFNPIKLVMLMNDGYVDKNYPERDYTGPVFRSFDPQTLITIVENMVAANANPEEFDEGVVREIERIVNRKSNLKGKGTNFNINGVQSEQTSANRVEFRYFGGEDYEKRGDEMEFEIHRGAYAIMAAFDDDFLRREYLESLWNFVDNQVENSFDGRGVSDLYRMFYQAREQFDEETYDELVNQARRNPKNIEVIFQNADRASRGKQESDIDPQDYVKRIVNANSDTIEEIIEEYFDILISVIQKGRSSTMRALVMSLGTSRLFANSVASEDRLVVLSELIAGDRRTNDNYAQALFRDIASVIAKWWIEEEADRDILRRYNQNEVRQWAAVAITEHVDEYIDDGSRTLDELRDAIDFVRLG